LASFRLAADTSTPVAVEATTARVAKPATMTCRDFLDYDDVTRPRIVYWLAGFRRRETSDSVVIDRDRTNRLIPVLLDECTDDPNASFLSKTIEALKSTR
jgi:acid stress chaperone HdeA